MTRGGSTPDPDGFRAVLGSFATGVSVMTTLVDGIPHGMTASAVSSVSLDPPLVLVCVERDAKMAGHVVEGGVFALSFLGEDQALLAIAFADPDRPDGEAQFTGVATTTALTGARIVRGGVGWVDCRVWSIADGGDHLIVVGEVVALDTDTDAPLVYYRAEYGRFHPVA